MIKSEEQTYYKKRLPDLIEKLKSQVKKNMDVINREVESDIGEDKFLNVLKGRKLAVIYCLSTIEKILKLDNNKEYRKNQIKKLVSRLKEMVDINMEVIDIDIEEADDNYKVLTEDKYISVLKARDMAGEDTEWALNKIDALENELQGKEVEKEIKKSWAKVAAEKK